MHDDYLDATRYSQELFMRRYLGRWNIKEENNMYIPGKLREDLKRIYGNIDPLNCIENIMVKEGYTGTLIEMTLRVPTSCERYVHYTTDVPKAPEKTVEETRKKETLNLAKPKRVLFSGPKTIVFWPDGSKTMVSLGEGQEHDEYTAFCAAVAKKLFGATHKAKKFLESVKVVQKKKEKNADDSI